MHAARDLDDPDRPVGRALLCQILALWAERRGEGVHVVFDGPEPASGFAEQIRSAGVSVTFSGPRREADEEIIRLIETDSAARRLLVVSTDHQIVRAARRRRADSVRCDDFWKAVRSDLARPIPPPVLPEEKTLGIDGDEAKRWMRRFGFEEGDSG